ncbi:MAG: 4Fe-4S binding protein [Tannerella sp.]|jgi:ferredoxin|nr:4Fe-4S binding protein [Tannerella sp.]
MSKKSPHVLKVLRIILAIAVFAPILLIFVDFRDVLPDSVARFLEIQLTPAIFSYAAVLLIIYFLLTLFFGRLYCSIICPAGILQDILNRIACIGRKKKNGTLRFRYHKPPNILRYVILGITALLACFGLTELCLLLDPYSNFGRIATNLFRPVAVWVNNLLAEELSKTGNYSLYNVSIRISTAALTAAIIAFLTFAVMVFFRGRLFCNSICPVGSLLSLVSRYSLFRITIDENRCNKCGVCERSCKAEAIDSKNGAADASLCVSCFNCLSSCNKDALGFRFAPTAVFNKKTSKADFSESRRSFFASTAIIAGSIPLALRAQDAPDEPSATPVIPPGSLNIERFKDLCTGCHLCVVQCPSKVLLPAGLQYGLGYMLKPYMSYIDSYCNFNCTVCAHVCPTDAIKPISEDEKKVIQIGVANFYIDRCVVKTDEKDCGACSEHCPTQAVHMVPYKGTLTIPQVEPEICVGCGGCESICPVVPQRAIIVHSNPIHKTAEKPKDDEVKDVEINDFGF